LERAANLDNPFWNAIRWIQNILFNMYYLILDVEFMYHFFFLFFSLVGNWYPQFFAVHMLDLSLRSPTVRNVLSAVTLNGKSILLTGLLVLVILYIYSMIGFFKFSEDYSGSQTPGYLGCGTLFQCLLSTIEGIRAGGGIGDILQPSNGISNPGTDYPGRFVFDMTFYILIIIILNNMVFGIILDTFGELREKKDDIDEDISSRCFICSLEADLFQHKALGFAHHNKYEHHIWNYLYFFIYLDQKSEDDYTTAEHWVNSRRKISAIDFFPVERSISIPEEKED